MSESIWNGVSGDWNTAQNWRENITPDENAIAVLTGSAPQTISGNALFGSLQVAAPQILLSGYFQASGAAGVVADVNSEGGLAEAYGSNAAPANGTVSDDDSGSADRTLTVLPWSFVSTAEVQLYYTQLFLEGELLVSKGVIEEAHLSGSEAFLGIDNVLTIGTLDLQNQSAVAGNLNLENGGTITADDTSSFGSGTLSASGTAALQIQSTVSTSETYNLTTSIFLGEGGALNIDCQPNITIDLCGNVAGEGAVSFENQNVILEGGANVSGTLQLKSTSLNVLDGGLTNSALLLLETSVLTLSNNSIVSKTCRVVCSGADTVNAANANVGVRLADYGNLTFVGGGQSNTVIGGAGSHVNLLGNGNDLVLAQQSGNQLLDARGATGSVTYFGGSGSGVSTVLAGSGSVTAVAGNGDLYAIGSAGQFAAWGGDGRDTLIGGSSANTLVGSAGDMIFGHGASDNVLVGLTGGVLLDASGCSGNATVFAVGGNSPTTIDGGSGSETLVTLNGNALVTGGSGNELIWGGQAAPDTIIGGTGSDTIVGTAGSSIQMNGSEQYEILVYGGGAFVDGSTYSGESTVFTGGTGVSYIDGGGSRETIVATSGTLHAVGGTGFNAIFGGPGGRDTIVGGPNNNALFGENGAYVMTEGSGTNYLQASGANVTLNGAASSGYESFVCEGGASATVIYAGKGQSSITSGGNSALIHVAGGDVTLQGGNADITVFLDQVSVAGTLNCFGWSSADEIWSGTSEVSVGTADVAGGNIAFMVGQESIILHK